MKKDNLTIFNFMTNVFILILLFLSGLSYADTNGIWQFANDTRPGVFGFDEGADVTNNFTFINPVYFNLGLYSTGLSTFTDLRTNLFNANSATIATQLTLTGFNCNANSKLRTDAFGNVVCSPDNVNDADFVVGNEYPIAGAGITITAPRTVNANDISPTNEIQILSKTGSTITLSRGGGSVIDAQGVTVETDPTVPAYVKDGTSWSEVTGKPVGFADNVDNVGIVTQTCPAGQVLKSVGTNSKTCVTDQKGITAETDPQVRTVTNGKWCTGVAGGKIDCTSAAPSGGNLVCIQKYNSSTAVNRAWVYSVCTPSDGILTGGGCSTSWYNNQFIKRSERVSGGRGNNGAWMCEVQSTFSTASVTANSQATCCKIQ